MISTRRTILMTMAVFALQPLALGAWLALIPHVKETLDLSKAELAFALLGQPLAVIPGLQIASRVLNLIGPRRILALGFVMQPFAYLLPINATGQGTLFLALMVIGLASAFTQVCLNVYAGRLEKQLFVTVMSRCHGFWALGLMVGSFLIVVFASLGVLNSLMLIAVPSAIIGAYIALTLPKLDGEASGAKSPPRRKFSELPRALIYISLFVMAIAMSEGAMSDWAAIYLAERLPPEATHAGIAITIFAGFLAMGRMIGDVLKTWLGAAGLARWTIGLAIIGLCIMVLPLPLVFVYISFGFMGLGLSVGFPLGVSAVAALDDRYESANIAIMSSVALCGFLIGPPLIGLLSDSFSLRIGLAALLPGLIGAFWLSHVLKHR